MKSQISIRLSNIAFEQLRELQEKTGRSSSTVLEVALEFYYRDFISSKTGRELEKDQTQPAQVEKALTSSASEKPVKTAVVEPGAPFLGGGVDARLPGRARDKRRKRH